MMVIGFVARAFSVLLCLNIIQGVLSYTCPPGFDCVSQQICTNKPAVCDPGLYCPGDTVLAARLCARGKFCATSNSSETCTLGHFCPTYTIDPLPCLGGSLCGKGARKDIWYLLFLLEVLAFAFAMGVWFYRSKTRVPLLEKAPSNPKSVNVKVTHDSKSPKIDLSLTNVGVTITHKKARRELLNGATGEFRSGKVAVIMGPSGAGKTTLLNVISGRIPHTTGNLYINGVKDSIAKYDKLVGFVPQDDTMLRVLTVRQILDHSARMRLPASMSWAEKTQVVDNVIDVLGLSNVQHSQIGDDVTRGISGGERKRVNIGIELVARPSVLFLDEPTTGLDSSSAKDVVTCLHDISRSGITVVAVLHQPRFEILTLCDDLLLLGKGGKTAYMGPISNALAYFKAVGYECPAHLNPADFFIDITSGRLPIDPDSPPVVLPPPLIVSPPQGSPEVDRVRIIGRTRGRTNSKLGASSSTTQIEAPPSPTGGIAKPFATLENYRGRTLSGIERSHGIAADRLLAEPMGRSSSFTSSDGGRESPPLLAAHHRADTRMRSDSHEFDPSELINHWDTRARAMSDAIDSQVNVGGSVAVTDSLKKSVGPSTGFFAQFALFFYRCLLQQKQDLRRLLTELVYQVLPGLALGYSTNFELYTPPIPAALVPLCPAIVRHKCEIDSVGRQVETIIFYITMVASAAAAATATSRFGEEKANYKRERRSGINIYAYFLAKNIYDLIDVVRCVLLFLATFFLLGGFVGKFGDWFITMFMMSFAAYGMGYFLSMVAQYNKAIVASVVCCIMWSVTSGLNPSLEQVKNYSVLQLFWWLSYARWGGEALNLTLLTDFPQLKERMHYSMRAQGYDPDGFGLDMGMLLVIGIIWRGLAFIGLLGFRRLWHKIFKKNTKKPQAKN